MREKFLSAGYVETTEPREADLFVVNTCTVTGEGDRKSRAVIRRMHRENPGARIAVTGCYATLNADELHALPGVAFVIPNEDKPEIVRRVSVDELGKHCGDGGEDLQPVYSSLSISYFADHSRAFVKVQDGCDHHCTYCKVVLVRGPSRSRPLPEIMEEAERLAGKGYQEIVLTGIQLGAYGDEWTSGVNLTTVLEALVKISGLKRIRLSSVDPSDVTEELIRFMKEHPEICPHLHLPLQSGDDFILKRMKRAYRREHFLRIVLQLRDLIPAFSLTTDVMVGFPGEEEEHFQNTLKVLNQTVPLKVHVFPFSPREGTAAARFEPRVPATLARERVQRVTALAAESARIYQSPFVGTTQEVLFETGSDADGIEGHTGNYMKVAVPQGSVCAGQFCQVRLLELRDGYFWGEVVSLC